MSGRVVGSMLFVLSACFVGFAEAREGSGVMGGRTKVIFAQDKLIPVVAPPRSLRGKQVGGMDLNDLILIVGGVLIAFGIAASTVVCYRHHQHAKLDPYSETLWRYKHTEACSVRTKPSADGGKTLAVVLPNAVLCVTKEVTSKDGRKHLGLANGSGWVPEEMPDLGQIVEQVQITPDVEVLEGFQGPNEGWEFFLEYGWKKYDMTRCRALTAAVAKGIKAVDSPVDAKVRTVVDLETMQQINMVTGQRRPIRRAALSRDPSSKEI